MDTFGAEGLDEAYGVVGALTSQDLRDFTLCVSTVYTMMLKVLQRSHKAAAQSVCVS